MLAHWHVARVGRDRVVFAAVEYPEANPPETICIGGTTYVREGAAPGAGGRRADGGERGRRASDGER